MKPISQIRRARQKGAEIVEAGLIAVPLFAMTFLLVDLSMVVYLRSTFQQAVREGVRYAITGQNTTGPCQDDSIKSVVKKNAGGWLNSTAAGNTVHVRFLSPVDGSATDNASGNIVEVSVESYGYGPLAPYQRVNLPVQITARAYDVMEKLPGASPCLSASVNQ
jgi:Flp pilus assembly protein TadG